MNSAEEKLSAAAAFTNKFPGFKFAPTDRELICCYLKTKLEGGGPDDILLIPEIDITRHEPWDLPSRSIIPSETEWFFFYSRGRKYPRGLQSKRMTQQGYWKSTGKEIEVKSGPAVIGTKRTLVFHIGRAPKGKRTEWMMHEYSINGQPRNSPVMCRLRKTNSRDESGGGRRASTSSHQVESGAVQNGSDSDHQLGFGSDTQSSDRYEVADQRRLSSEEESTARDPSINHQKKEYEDELDNFCRNILRDDIDGIVGSDDCSVFGNPDMMVDTPDPMQLPPLPFHGTASKRIRLRKYSNNSRSDLITYFVQMLLTCLTRLTLSSVFVVFLFVIMLMLVAFLIRNKLF